MEKKLYMAMADGDVVKYEKILEMPYEDFLIKADQYTRELKSALEYEEKMKSNG